MKTVVITGVSGQAGSYLSKLYLKKGYKVVGCARRSANWNPWRLRVMDTLDKITIETMDLADQTSIDEVIKKHKPELLINAGAMSFVGDSWRAGEYTLNVTGLGVWRVLEAIRKFSPDTRMLQYSSSEMFGRNPNFPYNEDSAFYPASPYGSAKTLAYHLIRNHRDSFKMFVSNLISFNFESPMRGSEFLPQVVVTQALRVHNEWQCGKPILPMTLGNIEPTRDWLHVMDNIRAVELILEHSEPDDFCIATGVTTSVREFCNKTFDKLGHKIVWNRVDNHEEILEEGRDADDNSVLVQSVKSKYRPAEVMNLIGDASKVKRVLGWRDTLNLDQIIEEMIYFKKNNQLLYLP